jgi:starch synthase
VSATYAREIQQAEYGFGLDGVMRKRSRDLYGIVNGIDYEEWDPSKDVSLPYNYSSDDLKGKARCRKMLCQEAAFVRETLPVAAVVGRLSSQKGVDLILDSLETLIALGINLVVLGKGDEEYQRLFKKAAEAFKGRIFVHVGFEERLARLIYAGSDFFLMPSRYEPCGLGQLIAMKYGTIPVARKTGGLADTIQDYDHLTREGTGFHFSDYSPYAMQDALKRALCVFTDTKHMKKLISEAMKIDFSWRKSTDRYLELYRRAGMRMRG